jgi:hypothetical protein
MSGIVRRRYQNRQFASSRRKLGFVPTSTELNWTFFRAGKNKATNFCCLILIHVGAQKA